MTGVVWEESPAIPFIRAYLTGMESAHLSESLASGRFSGDGPFTGRASSLLSPLVGGGKALLTTSCTHALEISGLLLDLEPGDEVILPSFTFTSVANAFALRGATPVFVDCRSNTFNIDERLIEEAITPRTKAIAVMHYGGVACQMDAILDIAQRHGLDVIEDNAHGLGGTFRDQPLGSFGVVATQSFHDTKNIQCGEGGALVVNDSELMDRAEIIREKGTNRSQFFRGMVDKYRWIDYGSSYLPSDILAAVLTAQLESFEDIQTQRTHVWDTYAAGLADWADAQDFRLQHIPEDRSHPAHLFALLGPTPGDQSGLIAHLHDKGVQATFHYVPLHSSPYGMKVGRVAPGGCDVTDDISSRLVRLPVYPGLSDADLDKVLDAVRSYRPLRVETT